jgi:hypothetical protein
MSNSIEDFINKIIEEKRKYGNTEFSLTKCDDVWTAEIGNPSQYVSIGEIDGEFRGTGKTIEEALVNLLHNVEYGIRSDISTGKIMLFNEQPERRIVKTSPKIRTVESQPFLFDDL